MPQGKSEGDIDKASVLFSEIQQQIDSKQLKPFIRTQYMRSAFQARLGGERECACLWAQRNVEGRECGCLVSGVCAMQAAPVACTF